MKRYYYLLALAATIFILPKVTFASNPFNDIDPNNPVLVRQTNPELQITLQKLQDDIGYKFKDVRLLELSLRRNASDIGHSMPRLGYDRLAFLGDKLLKLFVKDKLWREYHFYPVEKAKQQVSKILENATFGDLNRKLHLTERAYRAGLCPVSALGAHDQGDHVESLFGALYYDGGFPACAKFFRKYFSDMSISPVIQSLFIELIDHYRPMRSQIQQALTEEGLSRINGSWDSFIGDTLLDLSLSDFLCARYPLKTKGQLTDDLKQIYSSRALGLLVEILFQDLSQMDFISSLGHLYAKSDYKTVYDYVAWIYTCPGAPSCISANLVKTVSDVEGAIYTEKPFVEMGVAPKTMLDQILLVYGKKADYAPTIKSGADHQPLFEASVACENLFHVSASAQTKTDAEALSSQRALRRLSSIFIAGSATTEGNMAYWKTAQYALEWLLGDLGYKDFNYFPLGKIDCGKMTFWRYEVQGPGITPISGQGRSVGEAKANALEGCITTILDLKQVFIGVNLIEVIYSRINESTRNKQLIEYRDPVNLLIQISGLLNIDLQSRVLKQGPDNAPIFIFDLRGPFFQVRGVGKTKTDAKFEAASFALERIKAKAELLMAKGKMDFYEAKVPVILDLIARWGAQYNQAYQKASSLKAPRAVMRLAVQIGWLLQESVNTQNQELRLVPKSKSQQNITVSLEIGNSVYQGVGVNPAIASLAAFYSALHSQNPRHPFLERVQPLTRLLGIEPVRPALNTPATKKAGKKGPKKK